MISRIRAYYGFVQHLDGPGLMACFISITQRSHLNQFHLQIYDMETDNTHLYIMEDSEVLLERGEISLWSHFNPFANELC
jgi:hypothetical protein